MIKKTIILSAILGFLILVSVLFFSNIKDVSRVIFSLSLPHLLLILAIFFLEVLLITFRWKIILKSSGYDISIKELFPAKTSCYAISYLTPFSRLGGEPVRAYILKKKTKTPFLKSFETTIEDKIIEFTCTLFFVILGIFLLFIKYTLSRNVGITLICFAAFFILLLGFFYYQIMREKELFSLFVRMFKIGRIKAFPEIHNHARELERDISKFFLNHRKTIIMAFLISAIANIMLLLNSVLLMYFLGYKLGLADSLIVFSLTAFATTFPIPGALGAYEGFSALAFSLLGFTAGTGVAFSLLIRLTELSLVAIGVLFIYSYGIKLLVSFITKGD